MRAQSITRSEPPENHMWRKMHAGGGEGTDPGAVSLTDGGSPTPQSQASPLEGGEETTGRQDEDATFPRDAARKGLRRTWGAAVSQVGDGNWEPGRQGYRCRDTVLAFF